ncbi:MAG: protein arginine kinase [Clostridiales bacterium]|nr:protein arginine kinase [Clostridiales bacterium]
MSKWYIDKGDLGDVVLSTRIRLARNIDEYPFPGHLDAKGKEKVSELVKNVLIGKENPFDLMAVKLEDLSSVQIVSLAEKHLISPEFTGPAQGRMLLISKDEGVSIMLCEEDHIRLQVMKPGLAPLEAYELADKIDTFLDSRLNYAFDERLGYLTQCPTNLGTAMRASVMLHLPALTRTGKLSQLSATVSKLGLTIRGAYGEGTGPRGDIYQLSNQITLGITEKAAIDNLRAITLQIVSQERQLAAELVKNPEFADKIYRAYGVLSSARLLSSDEFFELISLIRMGAANELIPIDIEKINELIVNMQPATINANRGETLDARQRDVLRAELVREAIRPQ